MLHILHRISHSFHGRAADGRPRDCNFIDFILLVGKIRERKNFAAAFNDFDTSEKELPGNPYTIFYKGYSLEKMARTADAAQQYARFLQQVREGDEARYAYRRMREWGYVR